MSIDNFQKKKKSGQPIVMVTAYDFQQAQICEEVGFDAVLVGDSVAMTVHGHTSTIHATVDMMQLHTAAVARASRTNLIVADMPFMSYRKGLKEAAHCAELLIRSGAHAVKLEGLKGNEKIIGHLVESGIPVMGHLGLTPQHIHALGGYKVQGRTPEIAKKLSEDAKKIQELGCFSLVLECVPHSLAEQITESLNIPTIGIGAGPNTDGQILVLQDVLGMSFKEKPLRFVREYAQIKTVMSEALRAYKNDVEALRFPSFEESFEI